MRYIRAFLQSVRSTKARTRSFDDSPLFGLALFRLGVAHTDDALLSRNARHALTPTFRSNPLSFRREYGTRGLTYQSSS